MATSWKKNLFELRKKNLLLIFTRNPELGKCKTRLAEAVGDHAALEIYKFLLEHTVKITENLETQKQVHYSVAIRDNDLWSDSVYQKKQQVGEGLGERMEYAFAQGFDEGYQNIIIIGSDMYDLAQTDIQEAFEALEAHDYVIGPALDGGYYLFGMKSLNSHVFKNKNWGTETVLKDTLSDIDTKKVRMLEERNDIDYYEDIKDIAVFHKFLK